MDDDPDAQLPRTARAAAWWRPTPPELLGLGLLVAGAVVATGLWWWQATQRPADVPPVGAFVAPDGTVSGPAPGAGGSGAGTPAPERGERLVVHVSGAVLRPGVVAVPDGARVADAVRSAGGLTPEAADGQVNLARAVVDGQHVHVPVAGPATGGGVPPSASGDGQDRPVDLNHADVAELETLPGVGPAKASAIVEHRREHGPFGSPGDLRDVPGIGEVTFQRLAPLIRAG